MVSQDCKQKALKALKCVVNVDKACTRFEKHINKKTGHNESLYTWTVYQVCGLILEDKKQLNEVLTEVKNNKLGWECSTFDPMSVKLQEQDDFILMPFEIVEGVVKCSKCQSKKTFSVQRQTRGGDEPMTTFSTCVECGNNWVYSG